MSAVLKVLKVLAGFSGSILMLAGIIFLFLTLITNSMVANVDSIDSSISATMVKFVQENKADIREFTMNEMEKQGAELTKEQVKALCVSPSMLDMLGEQGEAFKSALTSEVCNNIDTAPFEETQGKIIDSIIENNIDMIVKLPQTEELKNTIKEQGTAVTAYNSMFYGAAIGMFLLGAFLTFAGVGFNWKRGIYKVCMKTGIRLATITLLLFILSLITADKVIDTMKLIENQAPQFMVSNAPPVLLKMIATVILEWMQMATNPYILVALISAIPFIGAAVALRLTILKKPDEEKNPADKRVV